MWNLLRFVENLQICMICLYLVKIIILLKNRVVYINCFENPQICMICSYLVKIIILLKNRVVYIDWYLESTSVSSDLLKIIILLRNTILFSRCSGE